MSFENFDDLGYFIITAQPNWSSFMNCLRKLLQYSSFPVKCQATSLFDKLGHGKAFIKQAKLPTRRFAVGRIGEDSTIQQSTMNISNHGTNVPLISNLFLLAQPCGVWFPRFGKFNRFKVFFCWTIPVHWISFIDRVDTTLFGNAHLRSDPRIRENTLGWVRMNSPSALSNVNPFTPFPVPVVRTKFALAAYMPIIRTAASGRTISSDNHICARSKNMRHGGIIHRRVWDPIYSENSSNGNTSIQIWGP